VNEDTLAVWLALNEEDRPEIDYWLLLSRLRGPAGALARAVLEFGGAREVFTASATELSRVLGLTPAVLRRLVVVEAKGDLAKERDSFVRAGASLVTVLDGAYPTRLRDLDDPPPCLFTVGDASLLAADSVAIVGSRSAPEAARLEAESLAARLAACGVCVVSGFAVGVDAAAHKGALRSGTTVAVLGCGIDINYPREHSALRSEVATRGLLLTELPIGTHPRTWTFPQRNRIIAAVSLATVVVGARRRSGALLTARSAQELGRPVGVLPGDARDPSHRGALDLLSAGAALIESADDVLKLIGRAGALGGTGPAGPPAPRNLSPDEDRVLRALLGDPELLETVAERAGMSTAAAAGALLMLEVKGLARRHVGGRFARA